MRGLRRAGLPFFFSWLLLLPTSNSNPMGTRLARAVACPLRTTARSLTLGRELSALERSFWHVAVHKADVSAVQELLRNREIDPNFLRAIKSSRGIASDELVTPLGAAAVAGNCSIIKAMLASSRVEVNAGGYAFANGLFPLTPLDRLLKHLEEANIAPFLISGAGVGASHVCRFATGNTQLLENYIQIVKLLLSTGGQTRMCTEILGFCVGNDEDALREWML